LTFPKTYARSIFSQSLRVFGNKMIVGYARVSSVGQKLEVQLDKLKFCQKIFEEKASGKSDKRPRLQECLEFVREGDMLVVTKLDRLGRSVPHLCNVVEGLRRKKVDFKVLDQNINTEDAAGRLFFHMLAAFAEFENAIRAERQMDGMMKAMNLGVKFGRKALLTPEKVLALQADRANGLLIRELIKKYGLSQSSVYRYLSNSNSQEGTPC
jgi:DNA invertase Pin-like site-specific DNA recombinase